MRGDRVPQPPGRQLPVGLRLLALLGDGERAAQGVVDRRAAGEQRLARTRAVVVALPGDLPAGQLEFEDELDGRVDVRPHAVEERVVAGGQVVVPDADRHVGAEVGLASAVGARRAVGVGGVPGAVRVLAAGQPAVGALGGGVLAGRVQRHRGLGVVPRVEVVAVEPRDGAVGALDRRRCRRTVRAGLLGGEHARQHEVFGAPGEVTSLMRRAGAAWSRTRRSSCRSPG